jgi:hypothetical protein
VKHLRDQTSRTHFFTHPAHYAWSPFSPEKRGNVLVGLSQKIGRETRYYRILAEAGLKKTEKLPLLRFEKEKECIVIVLNRVHIVIYWNSFHESAAEYIHLSGYPTLINQGCYRGSYSEVDVLWMRMSRSTESHYALVKGQSLRQACPDRFNTLYINYPYGVLFLD